MVLGHHGVSRIHTQVNVLLSSVKLSKRPLGGEAGKEGNSVIRSIKMVHLLNFQNLKMKMWHFSFL